MSQSRIQAAKPSIQEYFNDYTSDIFKQTDIATILSTQLSEWQLAKSTTVRDFIEFLCEHCALKRYDFPFPYRSECRYAWGNIPLLEILLTVKTGSYFTHYTAMRAHHLTDCLPGTIYLNHEQRPQPKNPHLEQSSIDSAFKRRPRESQNVIRFGEVDICMVNGMYTNQLGVTSEHLTYDTPDKLQIRVTGIERTLIDITVRPIYAGGVTEVLKAFSLAKGRTDIKAMIEMLQKLGYVYPYHQAIGYYLDRTGYSPEALDLLRRSRPMEFDFYLTHQMDETEYIKEWRLYVPKNF